MIIGGWEAVSLVIIILKLDGEDGDSIDGVQQEKDNDDEGLFKKYFFSVSAPFMGKDGLDGVVIKERVVVI